MNERIQRVLDGGLSRGELEPSERAQLERIEQHISLATSTVADEPLPNLAPAVLDRISRASAAPAPRRGGLLRWLLTPRTVTLRPAWGLAAAAAVLAVVLLPRVPAAPAPAAPFAADAAPGMVLVHFQLDAPEASEVRLAGDFTAWQPTHLLSRTESGAWSVVVPLTPGVHEYAFVVDGEEWTPDPLAPSVADGFGGLNSRVAVLTPDLGAS